MNWGPRPLVLFALSTLLGRNNKKLQVVDCAWLIALVLCAADLRARNTAYAVTTPKCTAVPDILPRVQPPPTMLRFNISLVH